MSEIDGGFLNFSDGQLQQMVALARRDDWHNHFVGSDIRQMLGEIARLKAEVERLTKAIQQACVALDEFGTPPARVADALLAALTPEGQSRLVPPTAEQKAYLDHIQRATNYDPNAVIGGPPEGQSDIPETGEEWFKNAKLRLPDDDAGK